jgi:hypothetical protein
MSRSFLLTWPTDQKPHEVTHEPVFANEADSMVVAVFVGI